METHCIQAGLFINFGPAKTKIVRLFGKATFIQPASLKASFMDSGVLYGLRGGGFGMLAGRNVSLFCLLISLNRL
ncbi:TPA: hypothetical protein ACM7GR_002228 [Escherichia coli]